MDVELGERYKVTFTDPDVVKSAECFGANGYRMSSAGDLLPTPRTALGEEVCPPVNGSPRHDYRGTPAGTVGKANSWLLPRHLLHWVHRPQHCRPVR